MKTNSLINYKDYLQVRDATSAYKQAMIDHIAANYGNLDSLWDNGSTASCITDLPSNNSSTCTALDAMDWIPYPKTISSGASAAKYKVHKCNFTYKLNDDIDGHCKEPKSFGFTIYKDRTYNLPDGGKLIVDKDGNYKLEDKDAKITYKACNIRDFNPYINSSDLLAKFVEYTGKLGLKRQEVLKLPIELFIAWLVLEAAAKDGDPQPVEIPAIPQTKVIKTILKPRCLDCGRFIPRNRIANRFEFCGPEHSSRYGVKLLTKQQGIVAEVV